MNQALHKETSILVPLIITIFLLALGGYLMKRHSLITSNKKKFLICGQQGSGKTNLFHLLKEGTLPLLIVSSLEPQEGELKVDEKFAGEKTFQDIYVIDFPANKKLKSLYLTPFFEEHLADIKGIIYLIDSSTFDAKACHDVAEDLLEILNVSESRPNGIDMLVFCNKNDLFTSKKSTKIKEMLETEIGKIHDIKQRGLSKVDKSLSKGTISSEDMEDNLDLAIQNGRFQFQLLESNVDFSQGNIFKDKWSTINDWLYEKIVN